MLMLDAGLRVSEACDLRWQDVQVPEAMLRVTCGKGGKARVVPIEFDVMRTLLRDRAQGPWLLYPRCRPLTHTNKRTIQAALARIGANLGIILHPHRLRHTYACQLLAAGVNLYDLAQLLGHNSVATTAIYLHVEPDELADRVRTALAGRVSRQLRLDWAA